MAAHRRLPQPELLGRGGEAPPLGHGLKAAEKDGFQHAILPVIAICDHHQHGERTS
jgi:hypothetical protein